MRRSEDDLIAEIRRRFGGSEGAVEVGIGDDAAVVSFTAPRQVVTTDLLVLGVDLPQGAPPELLARKAVAANLSDLAAAGAEPSAAFLALGIPRAAGDAEIDRFLDVLEDSLRAARLPLAGGDLSAAPEWMLALTLFGTPVGEPWLRRGAAAGEELWWFGGSAGRAAAGLRLLLAGAEVRGDLAWRLPAGWGADESDLESAGKALLGQAAPEPFRSVRRLSDAGGVTAAIDVSDGVLLDAERLAAASGVALEIDLDRLPVFALSERLRGVVGGDDLVDALTGGEEFALLATVSARASAGWSDGVRALGVPIGRAAPGCGVSLVRAGVPVALPTSAGFDHFAGRPA